MPPFYGVVGKCIDRLGIEALPIPFHWFKRWYKQIRYYEVQDWEAEVAKYQNLIRWEVRRKMEAEANSLVRRVIENNFTEIWNGIVECQLAQIGKTRAEMLKKETHDESTR